jgi:hypothetical protein
MKPGSYVLYATPADVSKQGGYYRVNAIATTDPMLATTVSVADNGVNTNPYVITLTGSIQSRGYEFYGYVQDDNGAAIESVLITATDANGNDVLANQNNHSDAHGYFHIMFPGPGTYIIRCTKQNYQDASGTLSFNSSFALQKAVITMAKTNGIKREDSQIVAGVDEDLLSSSILYPQPVSGIMNIALQQGIMADEIRVSDGLGKTCLARHLNPTGNLSIDCSVLPAGSYIVYLFEASKLRSVQLFVKQ